ncbi:MULTISPECIES: class II aldolase/adducin family protein [unclassified Rhizobium]|uniref:class II aldolase/adducin family protein n=1 Tax=unclassified Rhizobium TaxID=2613769 RepID=UPI000377CCFE|nr:MULTISPECIES: class II aldolase/adducin family protein [unclassified Rhizobium]MBB3447047.1 rhamnose utilization protein RhaD (predicted bifunctional aldolase and dehydrogenase) [Rhizobium sp. BK379]MBB3565576.1 rhamnose utilization protein RhaD (predicted bifunctional aldolase and dehydrogenase) [Rhizobium sp. BK512]
MTEPDLRNTDDFKDFLRLSSRIGNDILKTQGAGGNTSIKRDGVMWVKASGTWLSKANAEDIMVPVVVEPLVAALRGGDPRAEKSTDFVVSELNSSGLRPSIETSFHAALKSPVVAHYHCVNAIALAVLEDRDALLATRMNDLPDIKWVTIPYRRPGTPLAKEIDKAAASNPDVLILFNHGIIVCGDTVEDVEDRIERISSALSREPRATKTPDIDALTAIAEGSGFHVARDVDSHAVAISEANREIALGGSLYPDHIIFLGTEIGVLPQGQSASDFEAALHKEGRNVPKMLIVPDKGILLSSTLTAGGEVMARCLAEVVGRIPEGKKVEYLSQGDAYELTHWEAEQYRQALDRGSVRQSA